MKNYLSKFHYYFTSKTILILFLLFSLNGCFSVKPTTTKSGKNYFETFYVGQGGIQYFIKPLQFKNSNEDLLLDITFRYKNKIKDSAIVNFSINSPNIYKSIDSLKISNKVIDVNTEDVKLLFNEKNSKEFVSRFSTKIQLNEIKQLFNYDEWYFIIYSEKLTNKYIPNKKAKKAINTLRNKVFIIMDN